MRQWWFSCPNCASQAPSKVRCRLRVKLRPTDQPGSRRRGWNRLKADVNSPTQELRRMMVDLCLRGV